ncbi:uncharacterized protein KRP23_3595 [Phytophthora ramorum]|uniref:uncharacterized protein n=1 Tax=Phytophthora ramorum TaxID=164328 RepID=UPI00309A9A2A|nr:hypothetical protein KRP23_3595 [Phytophthora ramorum]
MGGSDSKLSAQTQTQQEEQYAIQMKNPVVAAAMEALEIDKPTTGLKFYQLFAAMDTDGSKSIDLEEFHRFFELRHTAFSDLVFSNLGKQTPARGVAFDDFVLNMWNFCTMSSQDIYTHVFRLYDDDHNGTLDAAECESLFRLLYHTDTLPSIVKSQLKSMTSNENGVITLDVFLAMCSSKTNLFKPIFDLQTRARTKSLGVNYWSTVTKKRAKLLSGDKDVFELASSRLQASQRQSGSAAPRPSILPGSPSRKISASPVNEEQSSTKTSDDTTATSEIENKKWLETWVQTESQREPLVQAYLTAFSQAHVAGQQLKEQTQKVSAAPGTDQLLLELRYSIAVSTKRRDEAKSALEELWEQEQSSLITERHEAVTNLVKSISTRTLHKQTGKKSADKVVRSYTQKKLITEENVIRGRFSERWQMLERAAELRAQRDLETSRKSAKTDSKTTLH